MSAEVSAVVTAEQLLALPADGSRYELVEGELIALTPAGFQHGRVALTIGVLLDGHVRRHELGVVVAAETGFWISRDPDTVRAADAAYVAADRLPPAAAQTGFLDLAPDLVVEVVSPSDRAGDVLAKASAWLDAGCAEVWVVCPSPRTVAVHRPGGRVEHRGAGEVLEADPVVPGLRLAVDDLFA